jgi:hypothetical protein
MLADQRRNEIANPRKKAWCFTLPNPTDDEINEIKRKTENPNCGIDLIIVGMEHGETGEFPHLQGYVSFSSRPTLLELKRTWGSRYHWEIAQAGSKKNYDYCTKEGHVLISKGFALKKKTTRSKRAVASSSARCNATKSGRI